MPDTKMKKTERSPGSNGDTKNAKANTQKKNSQLQKFFEDSLKDIYWAEKNLTKALPKMQKAATTEELKNAKLITGVICGYRVEEIEDKLIQKMRYLDKLIDELAKGRAMDKILRKPG